MVFIRSNNHLRQHRVERELGHPSTEFRQLTMLVECTQSVKQFQCLKKRFGWWRVHKVKVQQVIDSKTLETESIFRDPFFRIDQPAVRQMLSISE
ncbi:hypothetical protein MIMGU_mgv1a017085mg [Erythranthe guttata]|uniref:Uncharacterized protein n=1 Tax=Erythranthe guttata TaxID=4155 RepID=A0A022PVL6_ERYGU|nr:hypothetical protein MIMGU_mgv1a017085mg [Erythranthe guttata]